MKPSEVARLKATPPVLSGGPELAALAESAKRLDMQTQFYVASLAMVPGKVAVGNVSKADREAAVFAARSIAPVREAARALRRLAAIYERSASIVEAGIATRRDRADVMKEAL